MEALVDDYCGNCQMSNVELVWDCRCELGEGALWNVHESSIYAVDIRGCAVLACKANGTVQRRWDMPQRIGWLVSRRSGGWVAGFAQGVASLDLHRDGTSQIEWLHTLHEANSPLRLNDAKVDEKGRLWFGTMSVVDNTRNESVLYRLCPGGSPEVADAGYGVTNGPAFSPDGRTMYHTDTKARTIYAFDLNDDGSLSNKRVWVRLQTDEGLPDGMTTDADGNVWVAHWGGARVTQRDAQGGVIRIVPLPVPQVTSVAFGGPQMQDLYITTARVGLQSTALADAPLSGGLFMLAAAGQGLAPNAFAD